MSKQQRIDHARSAAAMTQLEIGREFLERLNEQEEDSKRPVDTAALGAFLTDFVTEHLAKAVHDKCARSLRNAQVATFIAKRLGHPIPKVLDRVVNP